MRATESRAIGKLQADEECVGSFTFSPDAAHTEIMGRAGLDFVMIDLEHAPLGGSDVVAHVRAAQVTGISPFVRVRHNDPADVGRLLDIGAQGVMFPHLGLHPEATKEALRALRYNPAGARPTCSGVRAAEYGLSPFADYAERSNDEVVAIGLVEDQAVVDRIEDVLEEYEVDVVIPGSGDLATSLGVHGQHTHPQVIASVERVIEATRASGRAKAGMYLADPAAAPRWRDLGVELFVMSIDYRILAHAYTAALRDLNAPQEAASRA
jgi:2-keto-3-deoxy-L-rhamnonate aldolase RhmA